jgi:hypothetical protein
MHTDRRAILQLVAIGRITPTEAERLLIVWNDGRETMWALSACIVISLLLQLNPREWIPRTFDFAHSLLPGIQVCLNSTLSLVNLLFGGVL